MRSVIRVKGVAGESDEYKALVLKRAIRERLDDAAREGPLGHSSLLSTQTFTCGDLEAQGGPRGHAPGGEAGGEKAGRQGIPSGG